MGQDLKYSSGYSAVLTNRNFLILWSNQIIQQLSFGLLNFSLVILVNKLTNSTFATAGVVIALGTPALLFGMFAGVAADTFNRRTIMKAANLGMAIGVILLLFANQRVEAILLLAFLISFVNQFFMPTESASIPMIVRKEELISANSIFAMSFFTAQILGLTAAGPIILLAGFNRIFQIIASALFLAFILVWFLPPLAPAKKLTIKLRFTNLNSYFLKAFEVALARAAAGLRFISQNAKVAAGVANIALIEGLLVILLVLSTTFVRETLGVEPETVSFLLIPPAGLGFAGTAYLVGKFGKNFKKEVLASIGILGEGATVIFIAAIPKILAILGQLLSSTLLLAVGGFFVGSFAVLVTITSRTLLQEEVPVDLLGRVFSVLTVLTVAGATLPILIASALADFFGIEVVMGLVGLFVFGIGLLSAKPSLKFRFSRT